MTMLTNFCEFIAEETGTPPTLVWTICPFCDGEGASSAYLGAFTESDRAEMDDEWLDDYRQGRFDATCDECHGTGKIRDLPDNSPHIEAWHEWLAEEAADRRVRYAENGWSW